MLTLLGRVTQSPTLDHVELLTLVTAHGLWGKGLSPVDAHLLGSVLLSPGTGLWTRDKRLKASARSLGCSTVDLALTGTAGSPQERSISGPKVLGTSQPRQVMNA